MTKEEFEKAENAAAHKIYEASGYEICFADALSIVEEFRAALAKPAEAAAELTNQQVAEIADSIGLERLYVDNSELHMQIVDGGGYWVTNDVAAIVNAAHPQDSSAAKDAELNRLRRIAFLIGSIYVHGDFVAETFNERELEKLLREQGTFFESLADFDAAIDQAIQQQGEKR